MKDDTKNIFIINSSKSVGNLNLLEFLLDLFQGSMLDRNSRSILEKVILEKNSILWTNKGKNKNYFIEKVLVNHSTVPFYFTLPLKAIISKCCKFKLWAMNLDNFFKWPLNRM